MVAPNPDRISFGGPPAQQELRRQVRQIVDSVAASSVRQPASNRPVPIVRIVVAAGRPFRVTVEMIDCDAAFGGVLPVVTIQEVTSSKTLSPWIRDHFGLTAREARVAYLLARRRSNSEIAGALCISPHTARRHTENVLHKLNVRSRFAIRKAIRTAMSPFARRRSVAGNEPARGALDPGSAATTLFAR